MLYFLYGSDREAARGKASALVESLHRKKPDAEVFKMHADNWNAAQLEELVGGQGLFHKTYLVYLSRIFENAEAKEVFLKKLDAVASSPNIFIVLEGEVDKKTLRTVTEVAEKIQSFERKTATGKTFNIFSLTDALGRRDRKNLWVLYRKALEENAAPEEIHGILFWQLKSMLVVEEAKTAKEAGLAPFVFTKAKQFLKNYTTEELKMLSSKLVSLYHDSRRGRHGLDTALERFVLGI